MNIYDISKAAGVSTATVSRVLNNSPRVSHQTKEKVLAVMESAGYVPNAFARGLGLNSMKTIGLICPDTSDPYLARALALLEQDFRSRHYNCLLCCTGPELPARVQGVEQLLMRRVDGLVLMGSTVVESREKDNAYLRHAARSVPVVLLNGSFPAENVYCVICDDRRATMEAAQHLADTGRRNILYLYHSKNDSGQKKLAGYCLGLESRGIPAREELIRFLPRERAGVDQVRDFLLGLHAEGLAFDAVLSSEDLLSVGAVKYARVVRQSIPYELSVIGYNNTDLCLCCEPEMTSVDNRLEAICHCCAGTMLGVLAGREMPQETTFTASLIKRGSTL